MPMKSTTLALVIVVIASAATCKAGAATPLYEGYAISGLAGKVHCADSNGPGRFQFEADMTDEAGRIEPGDKIELLPTATLDKINAVIRAKNSLPCKLWGTVTTFSNKNFIFATHFLPIAPTDKNKMQKPQPGEPNLNEPNDAVTIPDEVLKKMEERQIIRSEQLLKTPMNIKEDSILADRTGFIVKKQAGRYILSLDGLGRNINTVSFRLLPCITLQNALKQQFEQRVPIRFRISGIVTTYQDKHYLLLQRAARVYDCGNFN